MGGGLGGGFGVIRKIRQQATVNFVELLTIFHAQHSCSIQIKIKTNSFYNQKRFTKSNWVCVKREIICPIKCSKVVLVAHLCP